MANPRRGTRPLVASPGRKIPRPLRAKSPTPVEDAPDIAPPITKSAGDLIALAARIRACEACERSSPDRAYGTGPPRASVMLVAEHPSGEDIASGGAFTAEAGALEKAFEALQIPLSSVYGSTTVRCGSSPATVSQMQACSVHLLIEIEAVEPSVLVAFGPRAADAIRALQGRCGIRVPDELPQGAPVRLRPGLSVIVTEPLPEGVTQKDAKRRLWRDLQQVPELL